MANLLNLPYSEAEIMKHQTAGSLPE